MHASLIPQLAKLAKNMVRELDPDNDLEFLRIRSLKHEIMVAPRAFFRAVPCCAPHSGASQNVHSSFFMAAAR